MEARSDHNAVCVDGGRLKTHENSLSQSFRHEDPHVRVSSEICKTLGRTFAPFPEQTRLVRKREAAAGVSKLWQWIDFDEEETGFLVDCSKHAGMDHRDRVRAPGPLGLDRLRSHCRNSAVAGPAS